MTNQQIELLNYLDCHRVGRNLPQKLALTLSKQNPARHHPVEGMVRYCWAGGKLLVGPAPESPQVFPHSASKKIVRHDQFRDECDEGRGGRCEGGRQGRA